MSLICDLLWKLADKSRASADRIDDIGAGALLIWMGVDRRMWRLADRVRAVAGHVDDLAAIGR
ncbi:hypothetical protein ACFYQA_38635 [Streptomyces sp. NPDC005774]|uniref:hypothetical protein n=1 Tax=Streptomyces sp. NPDC005774 TaxID=3364728 RepID=UPI0036CBA669